MLADDLFTDPRRRSYAAMPEMDALTEAGALQEAALVDVRFDVVQGALGLLLDLRGALHFREGNTAILLARDVLRFAWDGGGTSGGPGWWAIMGSTPDNKAGRFNLTLGFVPPGASLAVEAAAAEFFVGDMPGRDEPPPDFVEDDAQTIRAGMQSWESEFSPKAASFLDPFDL